MLAFFCKHNYKITEHVTTNLVMAVTVAITSVFAYGFETSMLSTIQAMPGKCILF